MAISPMSSRASKLHDALGKRQAIVLDMEATWATTTYATGHDEHPTHTIVKMTQGLPDTQARPDLQKLLNKPAAMGLVPTTISH
jgi:hypothetical protein